jgi:hypothetical protein
MEVAAEVGRRDQAASGAGGSQFRVERHGEAVGTEQALGGIPALLIQGLEDLRLLLRAHPGHPANASVVSGPFELLQAGDAKLTMESSDRLGTDALEAQQVQDRRREFLEQCLVITDRAGLGELADLGGEILADARERQALVRRQPGDAPRFVNHGFGRVAVGADLEGVVAFDLEKVADLRQHARDCEIVHTYRSSVLRVLQVRVGATGAGATGAKGA